MDSQLPADGNTALQEGVPRSVNKKKFVFTGIGIGILLILLASIGLLLHKTKQNQEAISITTKETEIPAPTSLPQHPLIGSPNAPIQLTYAIHWTETFQTDGLKPYLEEYVKLHPEVAFKIQVISYGEYASKLALLSDADVPPDIYQIYAPWGVTYVKKGILDTPPQEISDDVQKNYVSTEGVTINGAIWGIPTEINTYSLLYNKALLSREGISTPPKTWSELIDIATKTTKYDEKGNINQYGIAFLKGNDWQVVDPFLALLFTNNGKYISEDFTQALFNSPEGVETLEAILSLFSKKITDNNGNFFDFKNGKVAMVISPPWTRAIIAQGMKDTFSSVVGVAPLPYLKKPANLSYSWFMGVMAKSKHKKEAWNFLKWFTTEPLSQTNTTRYGDLLVETIGAIPSRKNDLENHQAILSDFFNKPFIDQLPLSISEPNVNKAGVIKAILMKHIESAWAGEKTAKQALDEAAEEVNLILQNTQQ